MSRKLVTIVYVGSNLYLVEDVTRPTDPGYGQGHPFPDRPDNTLPGQGGNYPSGGPVFPGGPTDPGYGQGHPIGGYPGNRPPGSWEGRPDNSLPIPPVRPSPPITLPPGTWPPQLPPGANVPDIGLPPGPPNRPTPPIVIPPDPDLGIEHPIVLPELPPGVALLIALPQAAPKEGAPANTKPAILVQSGKKPVLVYVSAAATPK
jgi:hypothetical protein